MTAASAAGRLAPPARSDDADGGRGGTNPWLDLLRCLAIALVLARHGHRTWLAAGPAEPIWTDFVLLNGWIGVDLFLVLSGYLIGRNLIGSRERNEAGWLPRYLLRRALRILPAYYVVLLVTASGLLWFFPVSRQELEWRLAYHLLMLQDYLPSDINVVFWSLGVEAKFYLLAPLVLWGLQYGARRRGLGRMILAALLAASALRWLVYGWSGAPTEYEVFWPLLRSPLHASVEPLLLGLALALLAADGLLRLDARRAKLLLVAALVTVLVWSASHDFMARTTLFDATLQPTLVALLFAAAVAAAASLAAVRLPGAQAFGVGARLSYALYLVHFPLLPLAAAAARTLDGRVGAFWVVFLGLSLLAAWALHIAIERPFLRLGRPGPLDRPRAAHGNVF